MKINDLKELLEKDNTASIHDRNSQVFVIYVYKVSNNLSPALPKGVFQLNDASVYNTISTVLTSWHV